MHPPSPNSNLPDANIAPCHVGVVYALPMEAAALEKRLRGVITIKSGKFAARQGGWKGKGVVVVHAGVGRENAAQATAALIAGHRPQWVVSAGLAGGLNPAVKRGDIVMPDCLVGEEGQRLAIDLHLPPQQQMPGLHVGPLLTIDRVASRVAEKRKLGEQFAALAVDMESLAVAETCRQAGQRFLAVRAVCDAVDDELPADVERLVRKKTWSRRLGATAGSIFRRPSTIKDLWRLRENALVCSERLAKFLEGVIEQLGNR